MRACFFVGLVSILVGYAFGFLYRGYLIHRKDKEPPQSDL